MTSPNQRFDEAVKRFPVGSKVTLSSPDFEYEVARVEMFPHGPMVGIFDEPPSRHVDFWNPGSLHPVIPFPTTEEAKAILEGAGIDPEPLRVWAKGKLEEVRERVAARQSLPKAEATWYLSLDVDCPHCGHSHDLTDAGTEFWETGIEACEHGTDCSRDRETTCPECGKDFTYDCIY